MGWTVTYRRIIYADDLHGWKHPLTVEEQEQRPTEEEARDRAAQLRRAGFRYVRVQPGELDNAGTRTENDVCTCEG